MSREVQVLHRTMTFVLAGGQGERLLPLTLDRAKPAVPFGAIYRIIDVTLSNCIHSGLRHIYVLTQYKSKSLESHLRFGWGFLPAELGQYIASIPPQLRTGNWYQGTADAIYQNLFVLEEEKPRYVLILSGDHVYKMDYGLMLAQHQAKQAKVTISAVEVPREDGRRFGIIEVDADGRVIGFEEKPRNPKPIPGKPDLCLGSMGVYCFDADILQRSLIEDAKLDESAHDFGKNILPKLIKTVPVYSYSFADENKKQVRYWRDIGTLDSYFEANMDLVSVDPLFNIYDHDWPLFTHQAHWSPAKTVFADRGEGARRGEVLDSLVGPSAIISGGRAERCVLSPLVRINSYAVVEDSILMHGVQIGRRAHVRRAIIDKWVKIAPGVRIGHDLEQDRKRFTVTDSGTVVIPKGAVIDEHGEVSIDRANPGD
ncbi:MAG: glucose-1-phosphate adenylyltransferase [Planctomycetota bacterium]